MKKSKFVHLRVRSDYGAPVGICDIRGILNAASAQGMPAVGLVDYATVAGAVDIYELGKNADNAVRPIIGCDVGVLLRANGKNPPHIFDVALMAKDFRGYRNLCALVSRLDSDWDPPAIDMEILAEHAKGLLILVLAPPGSEQMARLIDHEWDEIQRFAGRCRDIFGRDEVYVTLSNHGFFEEAAANGASIVLAREMGLRLVASNDIRLLRREDAGAYMIHVDLARPSLVDPTTRHMYGNRECYFQSAEEMAKLFEDIPEALDNSLEIAEKCRLELPLAPETKRNPKLHLPIANSSEKTLEALCAEALTERYEDSGRSRLEKAKKQLEHELSVIKSKGICDDFLIIRDIIEYAQKKGVIIGPVRGSAAGSIVAYILGMTDVEPLANGLVFEEFLNPLEAGAPHLAIEIQSDKREDILQYLASKYGRERIAIPTVYSPFRRKAAHGSLATATKQPNPTHRGFDAVEAALRRLEGVKQHSEPHAAAVIIGDENLATHIPISGRTKAGIHVSAYTTEACKRLGLFIIDILGLPALAIASRVLRGVKPRGGKLDWDTIPLDDPATFKLIRSGDTSGVFKLGFPLMSHICSEMRVASFAALVVADGSLMPRVSGKSPTSLSVPDGDSADWEGLRKIRAITKETSGRIVFREQVDKVIRVLARCSYGEAVMMRRALAGKTNAEAARKLNTMRENIKKEIGADSANRLIGELTTASRNTTGKAHLASQAMISYKCAYLKAHFPNEFNAATKSLNPKL